jgi:DNA-directed RNA polymerase specialized sigma24 family protein
MEIETRFSVLAAQIRAGGDEAGRAMDQLVRAERSHLAKTLWQNYPKLRGEIEDLVAETFEKVWAGAAKCQCFEETGTYAEFRSLVQKQASFLALSKLRRESERTAKAEMVSVDEMAETGTFDLPDPQDWEGELIGELDTERVLNRITAAQSSLNPRQRLIARLLLTVPDDEVNAAICSALHISDGAAREAKRAVRQRLRQLVST